MDISDPGNPILLDTISDDKSFTYSSVTNGNYVFGVGNFEFLAIYDVSDPGGDIVSLPPLGKMGDKGGYAATQDNFVFAGFSDFVTRTNVDDWTYTIWHMKDFMNDKFGPPDADLDFASV